MNKSEIPKISVIMATKNAQPYLTQALDSIAAQTFQNFEVIVVDGGSSDDSVEVARSYPKTTCIPQVKTGFALAWNDGIDIARGEFIAILDSDDIWTATKLEKQFEQFSQHTETDCVVGRVEFFLEPGEKRPAGFKNKLLQGSHVAYMPGASMIRRSVFERLGQFEERWQIATDLVWFANLRASGAPIVVLDEILLRKRVHGNNLSYSTSWSVYRTEIFEHIKETLQRRRLLNAVEG